MLFMLFLSGYSGRSTKDIFFFFAYDDEYVTGKKNLMQIMHFMNAKITPLYLLY